MTEEERDALVALTGILLGPILDGGAKRRAGMKPNHWQDEPDHLEHLFNHLRRHDAGITFDPESGRPTMAYVAARAAMLAWQEENGVMIQP